MDKVDGPYYFFPRDQAAARRAAGLAAAGRRRPRRHQRRAGRLRRQGDGPPRAPAAAATARRSTWSTPSRSRWSSMVNAFCAAAGAPAFATPVDRSVTAVRSGSLPRRAAAARRLVGALVRTAPVQAAARPDHRPARHPAPRCSAHIVFRPSSTRAAPRRRWPAPASRCPTSSPTPRTLWSYWEEHLDRSTARDAAAAQGARGQARRDHRRLLGHRPGDRAQGRPGRRHPGPGRARQGQARGTPGRRSSSAAARPTSTRATSPTSRRSTRCASS